MNITTTKPKDPLNPTLEEAAGIISGLVRDFGTNERYYLSAPYHEADVRKDFIDKFLIALGWDVNHDIQKNPFQQEVKVERNVQVATAQRRADYALALIPHFDSPVLYVEAKKPCEDIATADNYFQTIRYANQRGHAIGILTSFNQLHVIDCRFQANIDTAISRALKKYSYTDFEDPEKFAEIFFLISRPAITEGSIDRYADTLPKPKGRPGQKAFFPVAYKQIDELLLETLDEHRLLLARGLKNKNSQLDSVALTELTQRILDRLVFIRFLEDKLIEPSPIIPKLGESSGHTAWEDFRAICRRLDKIYNGIVFKYHPTLDVPDGLAIDEKTFADILDAFDYHKSKYLFNDIPLHILGSIYERFLGNVIVATAKRANLDPKPEVRKAGGVYYTPKYIVDYIVQNTIGKLIDGKTPAQIAKMRFADIACGSGSFLLGAYDYLLKYIQLWYNENPNKAPKGSIIKREGVLHLSLEEKGRILTDNIYGVDIDQQAVEVSQLSLYLKLLEEETTASARQYMLDFHRPLLPSLADNIKCGNSLIGPDYFYGMLIPDIDELKRVNPFDWKKGFPNAMKDGGFDCVIGNPPWGSLLTPRDKSYLCTRYVNRKGEAESHLYFIEGGLRMLRSDGLLGFITPNTWLSVLNSEEIRRYLIDKATFLEISELSKYIFADAPDIVPILLFLRKRLSKSSTCLIKRSTVIKIDANNFSLALKSSLIKQSRWNECFASTINLALTDDVLSVLQKATQSSVPLESIAKVIYGIKTGDNNKYVSKQPTSRHTKKALKTGEIGRYSLCWKGFYLWWCSSLAGYRNDSVEIPKIVVQYIRKLSLPRRIIAALDEEGRYYPLNNYSYIIPNDGDYSLSFILGVLNSRLMNFIFANSFIDYNIKPTYLARLPIHKIDFNRQSDKSTHLRIAKQVDLMLSLHKHLAAAKTEVEKNLIQRQIEAIDQQIDQIVYELYGLTGAEIKIVEEALDKPPRQESQERRKAPRKKRATTDKPRQRQIFD